MAIENERVYDAILTAINDVHLAWTENRSLMAGGNISRQHYHARLEGHCERAYRGLQSALKELPALVPSCSKPEPANMECHSPHAKWGNWNYCPICGAALTTEGA